MTIAIAVNIDTTPQSIKRLIPDHVLDQLPDNASDFEAAQAFAHHMIWHMQQPKTMPTVRKHYLAQWAFLAELAELDPDLFDELQRAYADRAYTFDHPELVA